MIKFECILTCLMSFLMLFICIQSELRTYHIFFNNFQVHRCVRVLVADKLLCCDNGVTDDVKSRLYLMNSVLYFKLTFYCYSHVQNVFRKLFGRMKGKPLAVTHPNSLSESFIRGIENLFKNKFNSMDKIFHRNDAFVGLLFSSYFVIVRCSGNS